MHKERKVTLIGQLVGTIWMPQAEARLDVEENLSARASRFVNAEGSGLIDAVKSVVDGAGDFQSAKLTSDSFIKVAHRMTTNGRYVERVRFIDVVNLPSLADYVDETVHTELYQ